MDDIENVIEQETKINNVEPAIAEEIHEERIEKENQDEDILLKENLTNETITNVHTFLFDILVFFSNFQSSLIVEYCQETQNIGIDKSFEDGGIIFIKPNTIKLTDRKF
ncbi:unnamed protein product [Rotaria sp. Silwood2]|nr:unnamed protein product [Rotaria sp. Silwood2]